MRTALAILLGLSLLGLAACKQSSSPQKVTELDTVEVEEVADASHTADQDEKARYKAAKVAGVMPSDFPSGLPVLAPSSIVDFGRQGSSGYVVVDSSVPFAEATSSMRAQLEVAGWSAESTNNQGGTWSKQGQRVQITLSDLNPGARIRYEY